MTRWTMDTDESRLNLAIAELYEMGYDGEWSVANKRKSLSKFGRRRVSTANVRGTVWDAHIEEMYLEEGDGNLITQWSSSSASDNGVPFYFEGHYTDGGVLKFVAFTQTCLGQNRQTFPQPLIRSTRMRTVSLMAPAGDVWVYQGASVTLSGGVPTDLSFAHNVVRGATYGEAQSQKLASTFSENDAFLITAATVSVLRQQAGAVDFRLERGIPLEGSAFAPAYGDFSLNSTGLSTLRAEFDPVIIIPPRHDFRVTAAPTANNVQSMGTLSGHLATRVPR